MACDGRILLVGDEEAFLLAAAELLRREGFDCVAASDSRSAAHRLVDERFDLLVADMKMRGKADLSLIKDLLKLQRDVPTIVVTGSPSADTAIECIGLPVAAYLVKPVEMRVLVKCARSAISCARARHAETTLVATIEEWLADVRQVGGDASFRSGAGRHGASVLTASLVRFAQCGTSLGELAGAVGMISESSADDEQTSAMAEARQMLIDELAALVRTAQEQGTPVDTEALSLLVSRLEALDERCEGE